MLSMNSWPNGQALTLLAALRFRQICAPEQMTGGYASELPKVLVDELAS
jgi:hypothetical protein